MPLGIRHIEILVSNKEKSIPFYAELFSCIGWERIDTMSFRYADTKVYLKASDFRKKDSLGTRHICFHADNIGILETVEKFLRGCGANIIRGPLELTDDWHPEGGYHTIDFYDPDGSVLEVAYKGKSRSVH